MLEFLKDFIAYIRLRRKFLILPAFITLLILGIFIFFSQGSAIAPFIYTLF